MKNFFRTVFAPILAYFERGNEPFLYKPSHRVILVIVGLLFLMLAAFATFIAMMAGEVTGLLPGLIFLATGSVCEIVGLLGTDQAVARIWKSR